MLEVGMMVKATKVQDAFGIITRIDTYPNYNNETFITIKWLNHQMYDVGGKDEYQYPEVNLSKYAIPINSI